MALNDLLAKYGFEQVGGSTQVLIANGFQFPYSTPKAQSGL